MNTKIILISLACVAVIGQLGTLYLVWNGETNVEQINIVSNLASMALGALIGALGDIWDTGGSNNSNIKPQ